MSDTAQVPSSPNSSQNPSFNVITPGTSLKEKYDTAFDRVHKNSETILNKAKKADKSLGELSTQTQNYQTQWKTLCSEANHLDKIKSQLSQTQSKITQILELTKEAEHFITELQHHKEEEDFKRWRFNQLQQFETQNQQTYSK
eukprot:gb/GECH01012821.1/.p1 GENE.gb/GECH01012821.1/~~gb/GECH01012821.1/.p1  ORF type:complete len:143 (+),score=40.60 gb/GECH01012821.1/:1-429(+)